MTALEALQIVINLAIRHATTDEEREAVRKCAETAKRIEALYGK